MDTLQDASLFFAQTLGRGVWLWARRKGDRMGRPDLPVTWEEDGYTVTRTTAWSAPGCHAGCGIVCYVNEDGILEKVEGDRENPFNQGHICPRCACLPDVVNSPDRLLYPMKRDPSQRGNPDAWEQVTWDEALDLIYEKMTSLAEEYGPHTLQTFCGTGRDILWQSQRLAYAMERRMSRAIRRGWLAGCPVLFPTTSARATT